MKLAVALLLPLIASVVSGAALNKAVWHFAETIMCAQPGVNPLKYNQYGCWCGIGGGGNTMNGLDACCKAHDKCWEMTRKQSGCSGLADQPYIIDYDFTCSNAQVTCSGSNDSCAASVCECDREAAHCFARNEYNPEYKDLDRQTYC